jgi:UDP-N-acetyl-D-glucosamine dehydrogenase
VAGHSARCKRNCLRRAATMPQRHGKSLEGAHVLLHGVTYTKDNAEMRGSPGADVVLRLRAEGAYVCCADPYVDEWTINDQHVDIATLGVDAADAVILLQAHIAYDRHEIESSTQLLLDTCGVTLFVGVAVMPQPWELAIAVVVILALSVRLFWRRGKGPWDV